MTEEKIINEEILDEDVIAEDVISEEQLDKVSGGGFVLTFRTHHPDTREDGKALRALGKFDWNSVFSVNRMTSIINRKLSKELGVNLEYTCSNKVDVPNSYRINGKQMSRDEFWSVIGESLAANKK